MDRDAAEAELVRSVMDSARAQKPVVHACRDLDMAKAIQEQVAYAEFTIRVWALVDRLFSGELVIVPAEPRAEILLAGYEAAPQDISDMTCGSEDLWPVYRAMVAEAQKWISPQEVNPEG